MTHCCRQFCIPFLVSEPRSIISLKSNLLSRFADTVTTSVNFCLFSGRICFQYRDWHEVWWDFSGFPEPLQETVGIIPKIRPRSLTLEIDGKGKTFPLQAWTGPECFRRLRLPEFLEYSHMKEAKLSALNTGRLYPPRRYPWYSFC
jgi:hypothetical protein